MAETTHDAEDNLNVNSHPREEDSKVGEEKKELKSGGGGDMAAQSSSSEERFEAIEREYKRVVGAIEGSAEAHELSRFREELAKLHKALIKSHESEKRLIKKCGELNGDIVSNASKVQTALKLTEEDGSTISSLKKEIEKAWKMVETSHEKEARAKETIQQVRLEIANLQKLIEQGGGLTSNQEEQVQNLLRVKDELSKEYETQTTQISALRNDNAHQMTKINALKKQLSSQQEELSKLNGTVDDKKVENRAQVERRSRLEEELSDLKSRLEKRIQEKHSKTVAIEQGEEQLKRLETQLREQRQLTERAYKDYENLSVRTHKVQMELECEIQENSQLSAENSQKTAELKMGEHDIGNLRADAHKVNKVREALIKKNKSADEAREELERARDSEKQEMYKQERDIEMLKKSGENDRKQIEDLTRERDILNKNYLRAQGGTGKALDLLKIYENHKRNLDNEMNGYRAEAHASRKNMFHLEKEHDKYTKEALEAQRSLHQTLEQIKQRENQIASLQKTISDSEAKFKQQQNLYEAVRGERNLFSKNLIECQDEIKEMERRFRIMNHQIDQLKEELSAKDKSLVEEHFAAQKIDKEKENLKLEVDNLKKTIDSNDKKIASLDGEINKLNQIINEADAEKARQKKDLENVVSERDILGSQLIKRNDELALLYERIRVQQSTLNKGEVQYADRMVDVRKLRSRISTLKRELDIIHSSVANMDDLRNEVCRLQKDLLGEKNKVRTLEDELSIPMNVHPWRKLEGSDPHTFQMIQRIQKLHKILIDKTHQVSQRDQLIKEKDSLYLQLQNILSRQPGPEVAEQLNVYQENLKRKTQQLKAMEAELNLFQSHVHDYRYDIDRIQTELHTIKKDFFSLKTKERQSQENGGFPPGGAGASLQFSNVGQAYGGLASSALNNLMASPANVRSSFDNDGNPAPPEPERGGGVPPQETQVGDNLPDSAGAPPPGDALPPPNN